LNSPSPFSLPLMIERLREQLSTEQLKDRLARMLADAEAALGPPGADAAPAASPASLEVESTAVRARRKRVRR